MKTNFTIKVNSRQLMHELTAKSGKKMELALLRYTAPAIKQAQAELIHDFETHKITQEINAGPEADNISGTLSYGNLFSFIGFWDDSAPTLVIAEALKQKFSTTIRRTDNNGRYSLHIDAPNRDDLDELSKTIPWLTGRGWIDAVEHGLAGLGQYLFNIEGMGANSRSDTGLQVKKRTSGVKMGGSTYVAAMMNDFRKRLSRIR